MKERLNSDGQTSPAIPTKGKATFHFKELDTKRPRHMTLDITTYDLGHSSPGWTTTYDLGYSNPGWCWPLSLNDVNMCLF